MLLSIKSIADDSLTKSSYDNFSMQKIRMIAEKYYLTFDFYNAIKYDNIYLENFIAYCNLNIVKEHMAAYTFAALTTNTKSNAIEYYHYLSETIKTYILSINKIKLIHNEINKQIDILSGNLDKYIKADTYKEPAKYMESDAFFNGLINHRSIDNNENALLFDLTYIYNYGYAEDFIRYYKEYNSFIKDNIQIHLKAAKIYNYMNNQDEVYNALGKYIQYGYNQKSNYIPMSLFLFYSFYPLYTFELFERLFNI